MDVYLVPVGVDRYELYCELPDEPADTGDDPPQGLWQRMMQRFRTMIADAERERRQGPAEGTRRGWAGRLHARVMRWVAESVAEQRLLWHLRRQTDARLFHPDDLEQSAALKELRQQLGRDFDKHRFWLAIDSVLFVASGLLMLVPGPNLAAYFFAFRLVGHYLSVRGAKRGLAIPWTYAGSAPLTELRAVLTLDPVAREPRVHAVAETLHLEHLVSFFQRSAVSA